ncbi:MAG TPA: hypothetical protein PLF11_00165 [Bacillota bacterium]|nr:hypothetical protein [Dermatophilaceae bacterium]HOI35772.1 hypothetical protein [Bacillota bacterium]
MPVISGLVQGFSTIATGTPAAFCRLCNGGRFSLEPNNVEEEGIDGQRLVRKGVMDCTVEAECVSVDLTNLQKFFPTTAGIQMASFPDFLVKGGTETGDSLFIVSSAQPVGIRIANAGGPKALTIARVTIKGIATIQTPGTYAPVYNSLKGHIARDCKVAVASTVYNTVSWELSCDLNATAEVYQDGTQAAAEWKPDGYAIPSIKYGFSAVTRLPWALAQYEVRDWTAADITLSLKNGISAQDLIFTLDDWVPNGQEMPFAVNNIVGYSQAFIPGSGTIYNRVTIAAT